MQTTKEVHEKDTAIASGDTPLTADQAPLTVESIQKEYAVVMTQFENKVLDSISFSYSCHGEKQGTVTYFSDKGGLRMVVHSYNEADHYSATDRYFVKDSTLFFAFLSSTSWSFEDGGAATGATKDQITEKRIYLAAEQPIRCLEKKYVVRSAAKVNPPSESVPNKEISCKSAQSVFSSYQLLMKYRKKSTPGCLD